MVVAFLAAMVPSLPKSLRIFGGSQASYKSRLDAVLRALGCPAVCRPSGFRPGAATHFFHEWSEDVAKVVWRGRWASTRMLEHYIQELQAVQVLRSLTPASR